MKTASLLNDVIYHPERVQITLMMETERSREIRICLKGGQEMKDHHAPFPIVVEVFEGEIIFGVEGTPLTLQKGMLVSLAANIVHNLKAVKDSIVRLTISKADQLQRVVSLSGAATAETVTSND
ncbi:cupin domain-containing protein [Chitinophaga sp. S165]|uniref:cupin domain-containing protein n=1 Tax=Chitinophaga sp. S165 TaxID=2135462 RepID=UPI000D70E264|nr:cupin domain-containing protein [Chitinophaga sp. S165]PWV55636.1 quercetin dioxygenase-like cupin family protein [Chitinophaga sp. S165]